MAAKVHEEGALRAQARPTSGVHPAGTGSQEQEHGQVRTWLGILKNADQEGLVRTLRGMRVFLLRHFAHEEAADGLLALLREDQGKERQVTALRHEHAEILDRMDRIEAMVTHQEDDARIRRQIDELVALVKAHEEWENALLQEALQTDVGGCG